MATPSTRLSPGKPSAELTSLVGRPVRVRLVFEDANLYSFRFADAVGRRRQHRTCDRPSSLSFLATGWTPKEGTNLYVGREVENNMKRFPGSHYVHVAWFPGTSGGEFIEALFVDEVSSMLKLTPHL